MHVIMEALSPLNVVVAIVILFLLRRLLYELTTGTRRREMIRKNGCLPGHRYPTKGFLGQYLGIDIIQQMVKAGKENRPNQAARDRFYKDTTRYTWQFRLLGTEIMHTIEPENVKTILSTKFNDYALGVRRSRTFIPVFGHGIFDTDGHAWERSRALIRPNFTRSQVADLDTFESHVADLIDAVPRDGSAVDLQELFFSLTMDSATEFLFGISTNTLKPGLETHSAAKFVKAFVWVTKYMAYEFQTSGLARWIPNPKWRQCVKEIHSFADSIIAEALEQHKLDKNKSEAEKEKSGTKKERYVFLNELLKQTTDPYTLRSELLNVLLAGRDTTAGLLANTWWVLARRADIWQKLQAEIKKHCPDGERPDYATVKEMKYLRYILSESLRLMPVVPGNSRTAVRDTVIPLGGGPDGKSPLFVKEGTQILYSPWSMHRRTDYYGDDAEEFRPERWVDLRPGWEYLPFNGGPRICLGQQFALLEASYVTIRLCQAFPRIEPRDERDWNEWLTLTLASGVGTHVALFEK